jgi:transposase
MNDFASMQEVTGRARGRVDVLGAPLKRRSYSRAEKARLVAETLQPGTRTADVARRHGIHPQVLYAWRGLARQGELALQADDAPMFAAVLAAPEPTPSPCSSASDADAVVTIEFGDIRLRVGAEVSPERVAALVAALRAG